MREIGPHGTTARLAVGFAVLLLAWLTGGFSSWNLVAGIAGIPMVSLVALRWLGTPKAQQGDSSPTSCSNGLYGRPGTTECGLLALVAALVVAVSFVSPIDEGSIWIWLGASFLLSAFLGLPGCEMVAIPNLVTGRRHRLPCFLFHAIDRFEEHRRTVIAGG
jgi:hypothetical protein